MVPQLLEYGSLVKDAVLLDRCCSEIASAWRTTANKTMTFLFFGHLAACKALASFLPGAVFASEAVS